MTNTIFYKTKELVNPDNLNIRVDEHFYTHHGRRSEEWNNLLEFARQLKNIEMKKILHAELTEEEKHIDELYYGKQKPLLTLNPDGTIDVSDGRHRMQAIKELGIFIPMFMNAYVNAEPVKEIDNLYQEKGMLIFKRSSSVVKPDISYIIVEATLEDIPNIKNNVYKVVEIKDEINDKQYVFISKKDILNPELFKVSLKDISARKIPISYTGGKVSKQVYEER